MEAYIIENESILVLDDSLYIEPQILGSEIAIKNGQSSKNKDGRIDILAKYSDDTFGLIELKHDVEIDQRALLQLEDYLRKRDELADQFKSNPRVEGIDPEEDSLLLTNPNWIGILVGTSIDLDLANKLNSGYLFENVVPIAALIINRYKSKNGTVYVTTDRYFKIPTSSNRDMSKYIFMGVSRAKTRTVLAVIKHYVDNHPDITFAELEKVFPKSLQSPSKKYGVFSTKEHALAIYNSPSGRRYFLNDDEFIQLKDQVIAVCTQWGSRFQRFVEHVDKELGLKIYKDNSL